MRDKDTLYADIEQTGQIFVEKHYVGKLEGFRFTPDSAAAGVHGKAARHAAAKVLAVELTDRAGRLCDAKDEVLKLERNGVITWEGHEIGRLEPGEDPLRPGFTLIADEHLHAADKERIVKRIDEWLARLIETRLKPLADLSKASELTGLARGIAFRLVENFGILARETVAEEIRALDQEARAELRKFGVRFGAYNIFFPLLLKPAAADLLLLLWALKHGAAAGLDAANLPEPPRQGLTSVPVDKGLPEVFYRAAGFHVCGPRAIRVDMLERLADLIRPLTSWKPTADRPEPPAGAAGRGGFKIQPEMLSIIGCSADEMGNVLFALGFRKERRPVQAKPAVEAATAMADAQPAEETAQAAADAAHTAGEAVVSADASAPAAAKDDAPATDTPETEGVAPHAERPADAAIVTDAEAAPTADATTSAEPEYEEIWRPRRRAQGEEQHRGRARQDRPQRKFGQRHDGRPAEAQHRTAAPAGDTSGGDARAEKYASPPRDRERDRERQNSRHHAGGQNQHQQRQHGGQQRHGGGKPRPEPMVKTASPKKGKDVAADPDSPFAALLQLKERMARATQDQA
jgi:ATP-dependent RNA helicase SUPV3L1/SUV3